MCVHACVCECLLQLCVCTHVPFFFFFLLEASLAVYIWCFQLLILAVKCVLSTILCDVATLVDLLVYPLNFFLIVPFDFLEDRILYD